MFLHIFSELSANWRQIPIISPQLVVQESSELHSSIDHSSHYQKITKCMCTQYKQIYLFFFFFWLRWVFVAARGLSLVVASRGYSSLRCTGFSLRLRSTGSRSTVAACSLSTCGSRALERKPSSCGAQALAVPQHVGSS